MYYILKYLFIGLAAIVIGYWSLLFLGGVVFYLYNITFGKGGVNISGATSDRGPLNPEGENLTEAEVAQRSEARRRGNEIRHVNNQRVGYLIGEKIEDISYYKDNVGNGFVYVLFNPNYPNLVKIGFTTRSAEKRAKELSGTAVPGEYKVAHEQAVEKPETVEKRVHERLSKQRVEDGEFFRVAPEKAVEVIKRAI